MEFSGADLYTQWTEGEFAHLGVGRDVRRGDSVIHILTAKPDGSGGMASFDIRGTGGGNETPFINRVVRDMIQVINDKDISVESLKSPSMEVPAEARMQSRHDDKKALLVMKRVGDDISLNIETNDLCPHTLVFTSGMEPDTPHSSEIIVHTSQKVMDVLQELFLAIYLESGSAKIAKDTSHRYTKPQ